jgi:multidrug transporter EmrE-like cation transporter
MFKRAEEGKDRSWILYSFISCLSFGTINFLLGDLSAKYGLPGSYPIAFGMWGMWIIYRIKVRTLGFYWGNWPAILGVMIRGLNHLALITVTFLAFKYATMAHVNKGVIASLFTSGVVFTTLLFWVIYGEKPTAMTGVGMLVIIGGVVLVSVGKPCEGCDTSGLEVDNTYLFWSVFWALSSGLCFAINSWAMKHYIKNVGFTPI